MAISPLQLGEIGSPRVPSIDFSPLASLGDAFREGQKRRTLADIGAQIQGGNLDYLSAAGKLISVGDVPTGLALLQKGERQKANSALGASPMFGGGQPAPTDTSQRPSTPRADVGSSQDFANVTPDRNFDLAVRTVIGEAGTQPLDGQIAVAHVIKNRAEQSGLTPGQIVLAPGQFEPWGNPQTRQKLLAISPNSPEYQRAAKVVEAAWTGAAPDPTKGADHFYAPGLQAQLGRDTPSWAQGQQGQDIGDHRFFSLGYGGGAPSSQPTQALAFSGDPSSGSFALPLAPTQSAPNGAPSPNPNPNSLPSGASRSPSAPTAGAIPAAPTPPIARSGAVDPKILARFDDLSPPLQALVLGKLNPVYTYTPLADGTVLAHAPDGSTTPIYKADKTTFAVIAKDQNGNDVHGFQDPTTRRVWDLNGSPIDPSRLAGQGPTSNLTGDDFLKTLDPGRANQVKAIADGRMSPPGGMSLKSPQIQGLMRDVAQYEPGFDLTTWTARNKTRADFASGKMGQNLSSFNTSVQHLETLDKAIDGLNNTSYPWANAIGNAVRTQSGDIRTQKALADFETARQAVASELTRAFRGSAGNVADIIDWNQKLDSASSPQALHQAVKSAVELLRGRIEAVGDQYNRGMGKTTDAVDLLSPKAKAGLQRLIGEAGPKEAAPANATATAQQSPPAAPTSAAPKSKAEYDALPSGTSYMAPDGTLRTKQ